MMKCPVHKNHRGSLGFPGVMSSNPAVSGMISGKLKLTAGFIQSSLWRGLAQCFDLDAMMNCLFVCLTQKNHDFPLPS